MYNTSPGGPGKWSGWCDPGCLAIFSSSGLPMLQDSSKGGAVETGCSDLYDVIY